MDFLFDGIATALSFFYDLTSSYGLSIVLLTLGVMVVVTPLTLKSTRSMIAMQQLQPELRRLQAKYKDDRQKLNEEMMAFYREHNINPLGGCLPLLVQMPVFFVLYQVLRGLTRPHGYGHDMGQAVASYVRDPAGEGVYDLFGTFDPKYLDASSNMYRDLAADREVDFLGIDLADWFTQRMGEGLVAALPYLLLVLIVGVTAWFQQRQIMARNSGQQANVNPQQQALMKIMPFFLPVFSLTLPAGIVLYFVVSNLYRIGQQAFITRTMYSEKAKAEREAQMKKKLGRDPGPDDDVEVPDEPRGLLAELRRATGRGAEAESPKGKGATATAATPRAGAATGTKAKASTGKGGRPAGKGGSTGAGRKAPARTAPSANRNRSKKKKKRR